MSDVSEMQQEQELDYKAMYEKAQADLQAIAKKKDELLAETKQAKKAREEATLAAQKAEQEKAAKDGEFEKLWQTSEKNRQELEQRLHELRTNNRKEKVDVQALRIAGELADGDNIELLADFISRNLDKVADDEGALGADVVKAIKEEFASNAKYKSLLRASRASGGGAIGNDKIGGQSKTVSRTTFASWSPVKQMAHIKAGGTLTDN